MNPGPFVSWLVVGPFVSRTSQKLLNRFPRILDGGWVSAKNSPHYIFWSDLVRRTVQDFFFLAVFEIASMDLDKIWHISVAGIYM